MFIPSLQNNILKLLHLWQTTNGDMPQIHRISFGITSCKLLKAKSSTRELLWWRIPKVHSPIQKFWLVWKTNLFFCLGIYQTHIMMLLCEWYNMISKMKNFSAETDVTTTTMIWPTVVSYCTQRLLFVNYFKFISASFPLHAFTSTALHFHCILPSYVSLSLHSSIHQWWQHHDLYSYVVKINMHFSKAYFVLVFATATKIETKTRVTSFGLH